MDKAGVAEEKWQLFLYKRFRPETPREGEKDYLLGKEFFVLRKVSITRARGAQITQQP